MNKIHISSVKTSAIALKEAIRAFIVRLWMRNVKSDTNSITYSDYIAVLCAEKYSKLKKLHIFTPFSIIMQGWIGILEDYNKRSTASQVKQNNANRAKLERLYRRQQIVYSCFWYLCLKPSEEVTRTLVDLTFGVSFDDDRLTQTQKCLAELKGLKLNIAQLQEKEGKLPKKTDADYKREFQRICTWSKREISKNILLSDYIEIQNDYIAYHEELKRQQEEKNNGTRNNR